MARDASVRAEIMEFYGSGREEGRLERSIGPLELARSQELMMRYLPGAPAVVHDVGGGPGVYACWLTGRGYRVNLIDAAPVHMELAREREKSSGVEVASMGVGDARALPFADGSADAVVLHGPLYHLLEREERLAALREAWRALRKGGVLMAFAVSRPASVMVGLLRGWMWDGAYREMCFREMETGEHLRPESWPLLFTTAYFHEVEELGRELEDAGFEHEATLGVEGPGWIAPGFEENWKDPARREAMMGVARAMERQAVLSPHMVGIGRVV